uniref:Uncharacterized protein LOC104244463 n=1 Tax=Nicotiana sylvestris TaxID=4096 RepID=A0A1U7Y219_NICSY|nr:PREDICTED: uncharacterized protein LOC104244463 [Nicotiana sylvestris]
MIPTIPLVPLLEELPNPHHLTMHLEMSLAPRGSSSPMTTRSMKIMLWNYRGVNGPDFCRNLRFLLDWNNPSIFCLTEMRMEDHSFFLNEFNFTDLIQVAARDYLGGIVILWHTDELTVDPFAITAQEIHASVQVDAI